ncbi:N-acetyltransferase family protein [Pseudomonas sp. Marseille-QA0892]
MNFTFRMATVQDVEVLAVCLFEHGPNPWNYLPEAPVRAHLAEIGSGRIEAMIAEADGGALAGFISYQPASSEFTRHQPPGRPAHAYVCEAVVDSAFAGKGLGAELLRAVVQDIRKRGVDDIYIDRHADNAASAGMMKKAGFVEVETYDDPAKRPNGTQRTTVCRLSTN